MSEPGKSPRQFSSAFKELTVLRLEAGEPIAAVAEETGVRRKLLYEWRDAYRSMGERPASIASGGRSRGRRARGRHRATRRPFRRPRRTPARPLRRPMTPWPGLRPASANSSG